MLPHPFRWQQEAFLSQKNEAGAADGELALGVTASEGILQVRPRVRQRPSVSPFRPTGEVSLKRTTAHYFIAALHVTCSGRQAAAERAPQTPSASGRQSQRSHTERSLQLCCPRWGTRHPFVPSVPIFALRPWALGYHPGFPYSKSLHPASCSCLQLARRHARRRA